MFCNNLLLLGIKLQQCTGHRSPQASWCQFLKEVKFVFKGFQSCSYSISSIDKNHLKINWIVKTPAKPKSVIKLMLFVLTFFYRLNKILHVCNAINWSIKTVTRIVVLPSSCYLLRIMGKSCILRRPLLCFRLCIRFQ